MRRVFFLSSMLLAGMALSYILDLMAIRPFLPFIMMTCLGYIMLEVGLGFTLDKSRLGSYGTDIGVSFAAAALPWVLCALYFIAALHTSWKEAWLVGLFAAPTSTGVLFTLLTAAGLTGTWLFQKVRVLAIFDDVHTVILMVPLQVIYGGWEGKLFVSLALLLFLLAAAYHWMRQLPGPSSKGWLLVYSVGITLVCFGLEHLTHIHLAVILPAFVLGCLLRHPGEPEVSEDPIAGWDQGIKALFLLLAGLSLPRVTLTQTTTLGMILLHALALTVLSNLGKCLAFFFYGREASVKERLALSIALFPRGAVGAGVLLIAISYGLTGLPQALAGLSLAINLLLTGGFIAVVLRLLKHPKISA